MRVSNIEEGNPGLRTNISGLITNCKQHNVTSKGWSKSCTLYSFFKLWNSISYFYPTVYNCTIKSGPSLCRNKSQQRQKRHQWRSFATRAINLHCCRQWCNAALPYKVYIHMSKMCLMTFQDKLKATNPLFESQFFKVIGKCCKGSSKHLKGYLVVLRL